MIEKNSRTMTLYEIHHFSLGVFGSVVLTRRLASPADVELVLVRLRKSFVKRNNVTGFQSLNLHKTAPPPGEHVVLIVAPIRISKSADFQCVNFKIQKKSLIAEVSL